jgi:hypothetical protein
MNQFLSEAGKMLFPLITSIAMRALKSILNSTWKAFWQTILEGIKEAENKMIYPVPCRSWSSSFIKKDYVVNSAMAFIEKHKKLNRLQKWAVKKLLGNVVDKIIEDLNKNKGKRWVTVVQDLERELNNKLKIIDPVY